MNLGVGTWHVRGLQHVMYAVETELAGDHVLHLFSRSFLRAPARQFAEASDGERAIIRELYHEIQQFKQDPQAQLRYPDYEEMLMSVEELIEEIVMDAPEELRLKGLSPQARLKGLSPQARLKGLSPESRLKGLSPEARLEGLSRREKDELYRLLRTERTGKRRD